MNDYLFYGAMTEPIAPMDKEGNIDYELLKAQVQFQLDHKIHAIFVSGLTECMVTSVEEQIEMLRETVKSKQPGSGYGKYLFKPPGGCAVRHQSV